jgi:hypothetical protein
MDHSIGETLQDVLQRVGLMPLEEALRIAMLVCDALEYMHGLMRSMVISGP